MYDLLGMLAQRKKISALNPPRWQEWRGRSAFARARNITVYRDLRRNS
jgi:hypothetical protein